jgi:hypothetical protein
MRDLDCAGNPHVVFGIGVDDVTTPADQERRLGLDPSHVLAYKQGRGKAFAQAHLGGRTLRRARLRRGPLLLAIV